MYDFWTVIGAMLYSAKFANDLNDKKPEQANQKLTFSWGREEGSINNANIFLDRVPTRPQPIEEFRRQIHKLLQDGVVRDFQTPISLYVAAKLNQLLHASAPRGGEIFLDTILRLGESYQGFIKEHKPEVTPQFNALVGLATIDQAIRSELLENNNAPYSDLLMGNPSKEQKECLKAYCSALNQTKYVDITRNPTWDHGCREGMRFYDGLKEALP